MSPIGNPVSKKTDANGVAVFSDLPLGIYYVEETSGPSQITKKIEPFVLSLPLTNAAGTEWLYDVFSYPKNQTSYSDIKILKKDLSTGKALANAEFRLEESTDGSTWLVAINLNEMEYEWCAKLQPTSIQRKDVLSKRNGKPVPATTLGGGDPFHYTSLNDKYGSNLGYTLSNGEDGRVLFDLFQSDDIRTSYNFIAAGVMGKGKSTLLKKLLRDRAGRGDYV